jgi:hypothetical protein
MVTPTGLFRAAARVFSRHLSASLVSSSGGLPAALASALGGPSSTALASQVDTFTSAYGVLGGTTGSGDPWADWMHSYYRRPHPELLPAALLHALRDHGGGPLLGREALPTSAFLAAAVFRRCCVTEDDVAGVLGACAGAAAVAAADAPAAAAVADAALDTVLRAMWLAQLPACDALLARLAEDRGDALRAALPGSDADGAGGGAARREELLAAAASLFPPAPLRRRAPLLVWPLPAADLTAFEAHAREEPFPLYGASALWGSRLRALRSAGRGGGAPARAAAALLAPSLALSISTNMVEAYWAHFCATGDPAAVGRVCDAAAGYGEFLDEFGLAPVLAWRGDSERGGGGGGADVPEALRDDPLAALRFSASRFALASLLAHAGRHTAVGDAFAAALAALNDEAVARDARTAAGADGGLTAFGERRLNVMLAVRPIVAEFAVEAWATGVGSGNWPPSYAALHGGGGGGGGGSDAADARQPHAAAPALESSDLGSGEAPGGSGGGGFAAAPGAAERERVPGVQPPRLSLRPQRR